MNSIISLKIKLRKTIKLNLSTFLKENHEIVEKESNSIISQIFHSPIYQNANSVSVYLSMEGKEVSTTPIIEDLLKPDSKKKCFVPKMNLETETMEMLRIYSKEDLFSQPVTKVASFSIIEPSYFYQNRQREKANECGLELVVTPGLAFDEFGGRLGKGKGYYDKFFRTFNQEMELKNLPKPFKMGIAFSVQKVEKVPMGENDVFMDQVIFPK